MKSGKRFTHKILSDNHSFVNGKENDDQRKVKLLKFCVES
jgi:hypothetical protein